jgi:DNA-binding SARP family transcriptional activator
MAAKAEFCLLGPLRVRIGDALIPVPQGKQRTVLAALLLRAGQVVTLDDMAEMMWGTEPPRSARVTVQNYVMRLRKALGDVERARIKTYPHGYSIGVDAGELDLTMFEAHVAAACEAAHDGVWRAAATEAGRALALWRGDPLADVESDLLAAQELPRLTEMRLRALQTRIDADLQLGRHGEVIPELRRLASVYPLRERLLAQLMLALYRDSRQAEALTVYQDARRILIDELGAEPGNRLRALRQQILTADPALDAPRNT